MAMQYSEELSKNLPRAFSYAYTGASPDVLEQIMAGASIEEATENEMNAQLMGEYGDLLGGMSIDDLLSMDPDAVEKAAYQLHIRTKRGGDFEIDGMMTPWGSGLSEEDVQTIALAYPGIEDGLDMNDIETHFGDAEQFLDRAGLELDDLMDAGMQRAEDEGRLDDLGDLFRGLGDQVGLSGAQRAGAPDEAFGQMLGTMNNMTDDLQGGTMTPDEFDAMNEVGIDPIESIERITGSGESVAERELVDAINREMGITTDYGEVLDEFPIVELPEGVETIPLQFDEEDIPIDLGLIPPQDELPITDYGEIPDEFPIVPSPEGQETIPLRFDPVADTMALESQRGEGFRIDPGLIPPSTPGGIHMPKMTPDDVGTARAEDITVGTDPQRELTDFMNRNPQYRHSPDYEEDLYNMQQAYTQYQAENRVNMNALTYDEFEDQWRILAGGMTTLTIDEKGNVVESYVREQPVAGDGPGEAGYGPSGYRPLVAPEVVKVPAPEKKVDPNKQKFIEHRIESGDTPEEAERQWIMQSGGGIPDKDPLTGDDIVQKDDTQATKEEVEKNAEGVIEKAKNFEVAASTGVDDIRYSENLVKKFYEKIYSIPGAGNTDVQSQLESLFGQTTTLFFLHLGLQAWDDVQTIVNANDGVFDMTKFANVEEAGSTAINNLEGNYEGFLNAYMADPFAFRSGARFQERLRRVNEILTWESDPVQYGLPTSDKWSDQDRADHAWIKGLFGGDDDDDNRLTLITMAVTGGGQGYYSGQIQQGIRSLMGYYRNTGSTETEIFRKMTDIFGGRGAGATQTRVAEDPKTPITADTYKQIVEDEIDEFEQMPDTSGVQYGRDLTPEEREKVLADKLAWQKQAAGDVIPVPTTTVMPAPTQPPDHTYQHYQPGRVEHFTQPVVAPLRPQVAYDPNMYDPYSAFDRSGLQFDPREEPQIRKNPWAMFDAGYDPFD